MTYQNSRGLLAGQLIGALFLINSWCQCAQFSIGIEHDMSKPTFGLQGQSSSSLKYDDRNGLAVRGTLGDILGPPIRVVNGFNNIVQGSNMAGIGTSLKSGSALLGIDAKLLEAAGGANLLKGGLLLNGAAAKTNAAGKLAGPKGEKIANIIEVPVRVVAMKDLAAGKALTGLGQLKEAQAQAVNTKGQTMIQEGQQLKAQGLNQIVQGTTEGVQNIGNMVQKTSENINTAFKFLPIIMDMQNAQSEGDTKGTQQQQQQQQQQHVQQQQHGSQHQYHPLGSSQVGGSPLAGGSLFGGLSSLLPGLNPSDPLGLAALGNGGIGGSQSQAGGNNRSPLGTLFGANGPNPAYAAVVNSSSPLTHLLFNSGVNPFLLPFSGGPLAQALGNKQPIGTEASSSGNSAHHLDGLHSYNYNLFPGVRVSETVSSHPANLANKFQHEQQQQQQQQQQLVEASKS